MKHTNEQQSPLFTSIDPTKTRKPAPINYRDIASDVRPDVAAKINAGRPRAADPNVADGDKERLASQNERLIEWLKAGERLTPREAYMRGVTRLAARVWDLERAGHKVMREYDQTLKCAVYWMEAS